MKICAILLSFSSASVLLHPTVLVRLQATERDDGCVRACWRELVRKDLQCTLDFEHLSDEYYLCIEIALLEYQDCILADGCTEGTKR